MNGVSSKSSASPRKGVAAQPLSTPRIHEIAELTRNMVLEDKDKLEFPIVDVIERLNQYDTKFNYEVVEEDDLPGDYANYCPSTNTMTIRQSVYMGALAGNGRDRFTLAHELGHYFLHDDVTVFSRMNSAEIPTYRDPEWHANTFASAILMPRRLIKGMDAEEISTHCATSMMAAEIAFEDLSK